MTIRMRSAAAAAFALAVAILLPFVSGAQGAGDRDEKEVSNYVLTEAGLAKYTRAVTNLQPLAKSIAQRSCDDDDDASSLSSMVARMETVPGVKAALQSAGMATREYVLFSLSVFQNGMAAWALAQAGGKLPPGVQMANVNFYRAHEAAFKQLGDKIVSGRGPAASRISRGVQLDVTQGRVVTTATVVVPAPASRLQDPTGHTANYECMLTAYAPRSKVAWSVLEERSADPAFRLAPTPQPITGSFVW